MKNNNSALVYYLGNKQRVADTISNIANSLTHGGSAIDLFSGMGAASLALSKTFDVRAVDMQLYAKTMCSALIEEYDESEWRDTCFFMRYKANREKLLNIYGRLIEYEQEVLNGSKKVALDLSEIIENGCMLEQYSGNRQQRLSSIIQDALDNNERNPSEDVILRYYGGTYYSYLQALELAAATIAAHSFPEKEKNRFLAAVISAASLCASTIGGQFAQPIRTIGRQGEIKGEAIAKAISCRNKSIGENIASSLAVISQMRLPRANNRAVQQECTDYLNKRKDKVDIIYADPPYSRYHYSRYYHVLETIAKGDQPLISNNPVTNRPSRGIYRSDRYQSPYSTRTGAPKAFSRLIKACSEKAPVLMLSYSPYPEDRPSTPRMVTIEYLLDIANQYYKSVKVEQIEGIAHSKLSSADFLMQASDIAEVILICKR